MCAPSSGQTKETFSEAEKTTCSFVVKEKIPADEHCYCRNKTIMKDDGGVIRRLEESVNALYDLRDGYFQIHAREDPPRKWEDVQTELRKIMSVFGRSKEIDAKERAKYFYLLGRALNVTDSYNPEAEEILTKAIKLDAKLYQAWNELGETFCKKKDFRTARSCFLGALEQQYNRESLRNLSILMRTREFWDLAGGMRYAKEAVQLDAKDGKSWFVLGNAYTSLYSAKQDPKILSMCKSAYGIAERDERLASDPFLHFNRGIIEKYQDDYEAALRSFDRSEMLEPTWKEPQMEKAKIVEYLEKAQSLVEEKGKLKGKKLKKLIRGMNPGIHLGKNRNRKQVYLNDLKKEGNKGRVVLGVVVATFSENSRFNIVLVDAEESSVIVNVYNLPEEKGILVGSVVAIPDPVFRRLRINGNGRNYSFNSIRVENPSFVTVNGKTINFSKKNVYFTSTTVSD